jgi:hypothetical protein
MSTFMYVLIGYGLFSVFCTSVLIAACIIAGQSKRLHHSSHRAPLGRNLSPAESTVKTAAPTAPVGFPKRVVDVA